MGIVEDTRRYKGLELEFDLDITPDRSEDFRSDSGHGMKGKRFGSLLFKINTLGNLICGDFQAYEGSYNFKYGGLIDKKFDVKKGGSILGRNESATEFRRCIKRLQPCSFIGKLII
jgi:hypothetical protein